MRQFKQGDLLVYKKQKHSRNPGQRAHDVAPAVQDGQFMYVVDKYWRVAEVHADGTLEVETRQGKRHRLTPDDPNLRHANWWQRLRHRTRFPQAQST